MVNSLVNHILNGKDAPYSLAERTHAGLTASLIGIGCNVALSAAKAIVGLATGSISIFADSVNNLSDAATSVVSLVSFKLASKPADADHPFGHGRYEYLAGLAVAIIIGALGVNLAQESIEDIMAPDTTQIGPITVVVLIASMAVKAWMMLFNGTLGKRIGSDTLLAVSADSRNDVITTGAVLACALISTTTGLHLDGWGGLVVGIFITISGVMVARDTIQPLLGAAPSEEYVAAMREQILSYPGVLGTHDLMVHDYGPGRTFATAHVQMDGHADAFKNHEVLDQIERDVTERTGAVLTLHLDPVDTSESDPETWLSHEMAKVDAALSVHDLHVGETLISFDLVKGDGCELTDEEAFAQAKAVAAKRWPHLSCTVVLDRGFLGHS